MLKKYPADKYCQKSMKLSSIATQSMEQKVNDCLCIQRKFVNISVIYAFASLVNIQICPFPITIVYIYIYISALSNEVNLYLYITIYHI